MKSLREVGKGPKNAWNVNFLSQKSNDPLENELHSRFTGNPQNVDDDMP